MERKINFRRNTERRLSHVFSLSPTKSYEQLLRSKLVAGKFPTTKTGLCKLCGMLILVAGCSIFLAYPRCKDTQDWYPYIFPICTATTVLVQLLFYLIFSFGCISKRLYLWMKMDAGINFVLSLATIVGSVMTSIDCNRKETMNFIHNILGIMGGVIIIFSCGGILLMYRHKDEEAPKEKPKIDPTQYRFSVHV